MKGFFYDILTKIAFGKNQIQILPDAVKTYGNKALLVYGGGSIRKIGLYDKVTALFQEHDIPYLELSGVEPNPQIDTVREGVDICKKESIDVLVPVGGGSTEKIFFSHLHYFWLFALLFFQQFFNTLYSNDHTKD